MQLDTRACVLNKLAGRMCFLASTVETKTPLKIYAALNLVVMGMHLTQDEIEIVMNNAVLLTLMSLVIWHVMPSLLKPYASPKSPLLRALTEMVQKEKKLRLIGLLKNL